MKLARIIIILLLFVSVASAQMGKQPIVFSGKQTQFTVDKTSISHFGWGAVSGLATGAILEDGLNVKGGYWIGGLGTPLFLGLWKEGTDSKIDIGDIGFTMLGGIASVYLNKWYAKSQREVSAEKRIEYNQKKLMKLQTK